MRKDVLGFMAGTQLFRKQVIPMNNKQSMGVRQVNCPTCQKIVAWREENIYRPFCSKKCQLIDFGDWAAERNSIPVEDVPEDFRLDDYAGPEES
jgi:endogenous inhibitor of DNA gyrase (YacG/DUF329 family)